MKNLESERTHNMRRILELLDNNGGWIERAEIRSILSIVSTAGKTNKIFNYCKGTITEERPCNKEFEVRITEYGTAYLKAMRDFGIGMAKTKINFKEVSE